MILFDIENILVRNIHMVNICPADMYICPCMCACISRVAYREGVCVCTCITRVVYSTEMPQN